MIQKSQNEKQRKNALKNERLSMCLRVSGISSLCNPEQDQCILLKKDAKAAMDAATETFAPLGYTIQTFEGAVEDYATISIHGGEE